jgi:phosphatidate cytidylyltransferase
MRETLTRALSGAVYVLVLTAAIFWSYDAFLFLFGVFLVVATVEFCRLVQIPYPLPATISVFAYILFALFHTPPATNLLLTAAALVVSLKCVALVFAESPHMERLTKYVYLVGYIILPFVLLVKIPLQGDLYDPKGIFSIFVLIWINDTFAFLVGKTMGRTKLLERISPKKTVEGFIGGLGFAVVGAELLAVFYLHQAVWLWVVIAILVSTIGTLGDLVESKFKRLAGVKDSGAIMPGHGGVLDRLDSMIFVAPFVFLFYQILPYVS